MTEQPKILIVDDSVDTVDLLNKRLSFEGYRTLSAYNGQEALKQAAEHNPDLIVLDVMMPDMDGYEVCERLKASKNTRYIPILMLTAVKDKTGLDFKATAGDDAWLPVEEFLDKPVKPDVLLEKVASLIPKS